MSQPVRDRASNRTDRRRGRRARLRLVMPAGLRVSDRAFWRLCRANPGLRLERNANGGLIVIPPAVPNSGHRNAGITAQLWNWNQKTGLGVDFDSSAGFTLPNTAIRGPDASWMTRERWDALPKHEKEKFSHICPDFIAELRSKSDDMGKLRVKMEEYLSQGVRLGWLIDPKSGTVEVYRPGPVGRDPREAGDALRRRCPAGVRAGLERDLVRLIAVVGER